MCAPVLDACMRVIVHVVCSASLMHTQTLNHTIYTHTRTRSHTHTLTYAHAHTHTHTHEQVWFGLKDTYILCCIQIHKLTFHHLRVWCADIAPCLFVHRTTGCRCIMPQRTKPGQRWWQRCCSHTLPLRASLTWYFVELIWGAVCFAGAIMLPSGSDLCACVCVCVSPVPHDGFVQFCLHAYRHRLCAQL